MALAHVLSPTISVRRRNSPRFLGELQVLTEQHPSLKPDIQTYKALLLSCNSDHKAAFFVYDQALAKGLAADPEFYQILVQVSTYNADFDAADDLFKSMREQASSP